jgi:hypothetical protein
MPSSPFDNHTLIAEFLHMFKKIALIGQLGTGKSFIANQLATKMNAHVVSFGQAVYNLAEAILDRKIDKSNPSDRKLLVDVGTRWGRQGAQLEQSIQARLEALWPHRHGYTDNWVDALKRKLMQLDESVSIVVDDLRFENELRFLLDAGFMCFLVTCSSSARTARLSQRGDTYALKIDGQEPEQLATWLTSKTLLNPYVPTIWNDEAKLPFSDRLFMSLLDTLSMVGSTGYYDDTIEQSELLWRRAIHEFRSTDRL